MITMTVAAARLKANAAAVATAMAGGTTTAEANAIGYLIEALAQNPGWAMPPLMISPTAGAQIAPG